MPRLRIVHPDDANGDVKKIYDEMKSRMGMIPNGIRGLANSPVALKAYVALEKVIGQGILTEIERDTVGLVASQINGSRYCLAVHTANARKNGLTDGQILDIRRGKSDDRKHAALISFTRRVIEDDGFIEDHDLEMFHEAGYTDEHIAEVITILAQKTLTNVFNHVNDTELDFPKAPKLNQRISVS